VASYFTPTTTCCQDSLLGREPASSRLAIFVPSPAATPCVVASVLPIVSHKPEHSQCFLLSLDTGTW
jgi:hypothetical protein